MTLHSFAHFPIAKKVGVALVFVGLLAGSSFINQLYHSANLTSVSITTDNPRPSFVGILDGNNTTGTSIVTINTTAGAAPSTSSAQLVESDTIAVGEAGSLATHNVEETPDDGTIQIDGTLASGDSDTGDDVISSESAKLTVRFTTASAIQDGTFRILVPSVANDTNAADGLPDQGLYDFTDGTPSVTCPSDVTNYSFSTGGGSSAAASSVTIDGTDYHSFECPYSGSGANGTTFDGSGGNPDPIVIDSLINPAPQDTHTIGTADRNTMIVQHLDTNDNVIDSTSVSVGVIEAVKVTAEVAPLITFRIVGVSTSTGSVCGTTTNVTTEPAKVPFGELLLDTFGRAAQQLIVSTNASGGYSVTAQANDQLGRNGQTCTGDPTIATNTDCIQDSRGDDSGMSHTAGDDWSSTDTKGFAYSLHDFNSSGLTAAFEYDDTVDNCDGGGDCFRQFADAEDNNQGPETIFSSNAPSDNHHLYVCYQAIVGTQQAAGNYENHITYTATATF